jgi:hypothetical protein
MSVTSSDIGDGVNMGNEELRPLPNSVEAMAGCNVRARVL